MGSLKLKFHPLFIIYVFLCIYFGWFNQVFYYVVVVTLHEFGHYVMIKHYGYNMDSLVFNLSGAGLQGNNIFKPKHEIIISLAGPLVNLILIILTIALWWLYPLSYLYTKEFLISNIVVMIFNLIPIYPLDGGRIITCVLLMKKCSKNKLMKANKYICILFGSILLALFIVSIFFKINYNLLIIGIFMFANTIAFDRNSYFDKINSINKNNQKPVEVKVFRMNNYDKYNMIRCLSPHYYSIFEIENKGKIETIEEKDLVK